MRHLGYLLATILCGLVASGAARAEADFDRWVREFWPAASAEGVSRSTFDAAFAGVTPDPEVLEKAKFQPEFVRPMWDYVASAASEKRVATGRAMLTQHKALLDRIDARYEVDRHTLVAIWGMESSMARCSPIPGSSRAWSARSPRSPGAIRAGRSSVGSS